MTPEERAAQAVDDLAKYFGNYCADTVEYAESVISGQIKAALAAEWVPVAERLPPIGQTVLVWRYDIPSAVGPITAFWTGKKWCNDVMSHAFVVECWQPLPEPPEATP